MAGSVVGVGVLRMVPTSCVVWFESVWILVIQDKVVGSVVRVLQMMPASCVVWFESVCGMF